MADLTAAQLLKIRRRIGDHRADNAASPGYELSDILIEAIFDDADEGNSDLDRTTVFCLRERWGMAINATATITDLGTALLNQKQAQIKKLLDYWEGVTGLSGGQTIGRGTTNTYRADSLQTSEPDYSSGTASDSGDVTIILGY